MSEFLLPALRVGAQPELVRPLMREPLLFAAHYAVVAALLNWPHDVADIQNTVYRRYQRHDKILGLINQLREQVPMALSAELAVRLAEGLEVHRRYRFHPDDYIALCRRGREVLELPSERPVPGIQSVVGRMALLAGCLDCTPVEHQLLTHAVAHALLPAQPLLTHLFMQQPALRQTYWLTALDTRVEALRQARSPESALIGGGLLRAGQGVPVLGTFWIELLLKEGEALATALIQPMLQKGSPDGVARLPDSDRQLIVRLLQTPGQGHNVLLYGKPGVDKQSLAYQLICAAGSVPFVLAPDIPESDLPAAVIVAQRLLATLSGSVLVVTQPAAVLTRQLPDFAFLFGAGADSDSEAKPLDQRILSDNPVPTLWLTASPRSLHPESLSRFLFHAEAQKGIRADRRALVESMIATLPLPDAERSELIKQEGLSEQQLSSALMLATRIAEGDEESDHPGFASSVVLAVNRSQKALARRDKDEARLSITRYSLDYLHYAGRFGPTQILQAMQRQGQGTLCIYGLPGTGKTQFAEHLSMELGKPLLIKRASDILDKYLGESEKRLAEMFEQAEEEGAILLLDEADSFLRDRTMSQYSWEVTSVNELLQQMERFEGLFICTTNLYTHLDMAALRRFTFKIEFLPLTVHQRWAMFRNEAEVDEAGLSERQRGEYEERLALMRDLTPGDFATVKRQSRLLGETLSPAEWLDQLDIEVAAKRQRLIPGEEAR